MLALVSFLSAGAFSAQNSVNSQEPKIPYPWLVFNEKVKVNAVFLRDSTGVSDSAVILFGGNVSQGGLVSFMPTVKNHYSQAIDVDECPCHLNFPTA